MDIRRDQLSNASTMPLIAFGVLALFFGLGTYIFYPTWGTLPIQASVQAQRTDHLFRVLMGMSGVVFFLVQGLIYYAAIAFRAKPNDLSDGPPIHGNVMIEIIWTIIPSVIVVGIAVYSFIVWQRNSAPVVDAENLVNSEAVDINVYAQRFGWSFEYITNETDTNGDTIVLNSLNLHTYVGQHLHLEMETRDVIHSFWVPTMRTKQDLLPGRVTDVRFSVIAPQTQAGEPVTWRYIGTMSPVTVYAGPSADGAIIFEDLTETNVELSVYPNLIEMELVDPNAPLEGAWTAVYVDGIGGYVATDEILGRFEKYPVVCAELCGSGHGDMGFTSDLILWQSDEQMLNGWYNPMVAANVNPPSGPVDSGRILLTSGQYPCSNCHTLDALNWSGALAPSLNGIGSRADERAADAGEDVTTGAEYIAQSLRHPNDYVVAGYLPGIMPTFNPDQMPQEDLNAIVSYLCTQTDSGNPEESGCNLANLQFDDAGVLEDVDALEAELTNITAEYE
jgi:cytochrome c oxidase subunit II